MMKPERLDIGHISMQYSDGPSRWQHDARVAFNRGYDWITGTEAGEKPNWSVLVREAKAHGYVFHRCRGNWIAVKRSIIERSGGVRRGRRIVITTDKVAGHGHDTNIVWFRFHHKNPKIGKVSVLASHYPKFGRPDGSPAYRVNLWATKLLARVIRRKAKAFVRKGSMVFYGGDQNIVDKNNDTFFGGPLVSCWDELKKWPDTGHGNIDVIAAYDVDGRIKCVAANAYTDEHLFLHTDHFLIDATYNVTPIRTGWTGQ